MKEIAVFARDFLFLYFSSLPAWAAGLRTITAVAIHPAIAVLTVFLLLLTGSDFSQYALVHLILFTGMWTSIFFYQFINCCYWINKV